MLLLCAVLLCFLTIEILKSYLTQKGLQSLRSRDAGDLKFPIVIVTAHPDDETMFFGPLITSLVSGRDYLRDHIYLLCLSTGDYDGLGEIRVHEFYNACQRLGLLNNNVKVLEDGDLKDNPKTRWPSALVSQKVEEFIASYVEYDELVGGSLFTFDRNGISGHLNHISAREGVLHYADSLPSSSTSDESGFDRTWDVYELETVSVFRKYLGVLDLIFTALNYLILRISCRDRGVTYYYYFAGVSEYLGRELRAMIAHESQLVWFRWLYISFSRYMFINEYKKIR